MRREVRAGFEAGANNLSFGLVYFPGAQQTRSPSRSLRWRRSSTRRSSRHVRNEGTGVLEAIDECSTSSPLGSVAHVSHLKSMADADRAAARSSRADGVSFDQTPTARAAPCRACSPPGRRRAARQRRSRAADPDAPARIEDEVEHGLPGWENMLGTLGPEP